MGKRWVSAQAAARILEMSPRTFAKLVGQGRVTRRCFPGLRTLYLRQDVERLKAEAICPATAQTTKTTTARSGSRRRQAAAASA